MSLEQSLVTLPAIYDQFQCKGGTCRNTCCQGWSIYLARSEYNKFRHQYKGKIPDASFKRLPRKEASDEIYATIQLTNKKSCPFLDNSRLCSLQCEYGVKVLPQTCKQFPRILTACLDKTHYLSLDLGCERVIELLLSVTETGLSFKQEMLPLPDMRGNQVHNTSILAEYSSDIHNLSIWLLQNRAYSLSDRMILLGLCLRELDEIDKKQQPENIPSWFVKWQSYTKGNIFQSMLSKLVGNRHAFILNNLKTLLILQYYTSDCRRFSALLQEKISFERGDQLSFNREQYDALDAQFCKIFPQIDDLLESYMILLLLRESFRFAEYSSVWQDYNYLCQIYTLLRFYLTISAPQNTRELVDCITAFSRTTVSMKYFTENTVTFTEQEKADSLAHFSILVRG